MKLNQTGCPLLIILLFAIGCSGNSPKAACGEILGKLKNAPKQDDAQDKCVKYVKKRIDYVKKKTCTSGTHFYTTLKSPEGQELIAKGSSYRSVAFQMSHLARRQYKAKNEDAYRKCRKGRTKSSSRSSSKKKRQNGQIPGFKSCLKNPKMFRMCCKRVGGQFFPRGTSGKSSLPTCQK